MSKINGSDLFGGNPWSKIYGFLSFIFLCLAGITSISKIYTVDLVSKKTISSATPWKIAILWFAFSIVTGYISYRIAGGRRNSAIWKGEDLYGLIKYVSTSGQAKIGFHSLRDQSLLLTKLETIGIKKKPSEKVRQFIRNKIIMDHGAFDICRDYIVIQMIHDGEQWFWDGYGNKKTAQCFHEAEIIFDLKSSADYIFLEVLEGLKTKNSEKNL